METLLEPIELDDADLVAVVGGLADINIGILSSNANGTLSENEVVVAAFNAVVNNQSNFLNG